MNKQELGSLTAKSGFANEDDIVDKFNNWRKDTEAKKWLKIMGYLLKEIQYVKAIKISGEKTDVQAQITIKLKNAIDCQNMQVKLVTIKKGYNQIDKRWVDKYKALWDIPDDITKMLKHYTGELKHSVKNTKDSRRMYINEFWVLMQKETTTFLKNILLDSPN